MRLKLVKPAVPKAVTEVQKIVPVSLVFLLADGNQVISEYPDTGPSVSPEDDDARDGVTRSRNTVRVKLQLQSPKQEVIYPVVPASGIVRTDVDILPLQLLK